MKSLLRTLGAMLCAGAVVGGCAGFSAFISKEQTALEACGTDAAAKFLPMLLVDPTPIAAIEDGGAAAICVVNAVVAYEESVGDPAVIGAPDAGPALAKASPDLQAATGGLGVVGKPGALEATMSQRATIYRNAKAFQRRAVSTTASTPPYSCVLTPTSK